MELLEPQERALVKATVINKFRGDASLLESGIEFLEQRTGVPVLGVVPHLEDHGIPEEDSALLQAGPQPQARDGLLDIAVMRLPRISNFTDFEPLAVEPGVWLRYVATPAAFGEPDLVIVPGTKATIADLQFLRQSGLAGSLLSFAARGGAVMGVCGGLQMLGESIRDPDGVESPIADAPGLGLLPLVTTFTTPKTTVQVEAVACGASGLLAGAAGCRVSGYEIHNGRTESREPLAPAFRIGEREDGAVSPDGSRFGTYIHGLFDEDDFRRAFLGGLAARRGLSGLETAPSLPREAVYDRLAARVRAALDMERLYTIIGIR
jgi:adenosylcobyric acid synthase